MASAYVSFLVRLWREEAPEPGEGASLWQGEVEHIQSGHCWTFDMLDELLTFVRRYVEEIDGGWKEAAE